MSQIHYKLTDQKLQTYNGFQWEIGKWVGAKGDIQKGLCTDAWLHCYDSSLLAVLHNPIHAAIQNPVLWEVECEGETKNDNGLKRGYRRMRLIKQLPLPDITIVQKQRYAILCAKTVCTNEQWNNWADKWLSDEDRSTGAAEAAVAAARAAWTAEAAEAAWAAETAVAAARAAETAVAAARAAWTAEATWAAWAAETAEATWAAWAAETAEATARAAAAAEEETNFVALAEQSLKED